MKTEKIFIIYIFVFFLAAAFAYAEGSCCVATNDGTPCINSPDGNPVANCQTFLSGECSEHAECTESGACIINEENICNDGVSRNRCLDIGGEPHIDRECSELGGFQDICCSVVVDGFSSYRFVPENECTNLGGDPEFDYDEVQCQRQNEPDTNRKGCCVNSDLGCTYGFENECAEGIFQPFFCSVLEEQCSPVCESHASIGPGPVELDMQYDLYYLDSCENPEEIYRECNNFNEMPLLDGNTGEWGCSSAVCNNVWDNPYTDENYDNILDNDNQFSFGGSSRSFRYNSESWCEYQQSKIGPGLDLPGTQHYMHTCSFGEEKLIPSESEGRGKICAEEIVETGGYTMTQAKWIDNTQPERCLACNSQNNVGACCQAMFNNQNVACSYIPRVDLSGNPADLDLFVDRDFYNSLQDILSGQINNVIGLHDLYVDSATIVYYDAEGNENERSGNILDGNVIGDSDLTENACNDENGFCLLRLFETPSFAGTYNLEVEYSGHICWLGTGRWCGSDRCCGRYDESGSRSLGQHTFNFDTSGVCVPLVPPSTSAFCNQFLDTGNVVNSDGETESYLEFNYYYDYPFTSLGQLGTCDSTEECRQRLFETFSYRTSGSLVADDLNSMCRSLGDCGISHNIAGTDTILGFAMSNVCSALTYNDESEDVCISPELIYPTISAGEFQALSQGSPIRPEDSLPVIFFLPFSFRRKIKKNYILILFLSFFVLAGCAGGIIPNYSPPPSVVQCNAWQPPLNTNDCWKCSATWDEERNGQKGLLPPVDLKTIDGERAYKCTRYLCESLGSCEYLEGLEDETSEPTCVPLEPDVIRIPKIVLEGVPDFTCNLFNPEGCAESNYQIQNEKHVLISGKLEPFLPVEIKFKTVDVNDPSAGVPTNCEFDDNANMESPENLPIPDGGARAVDHIFRVVNHAARESNYKYYIRCISTDGPTSSPHASLEFNVGVQGYTTPIIRSAIPESGSSYVRHGVSTKEVVLNVVGNAVECRWSNQNVDFGEMADTRIVSTRVVDGVEDVHTETISNTGFGCSALGSDGTRRCTASLSGIQEGENRFWFSCAGRVQECDDLLNDITHDQIDSYLDCSGTQQQCNVIINNRLNDANNYLNCLREGGDTSDPWPEEGYIVTGTSALEISNVKCLHSLGEECGTIYDNSFDAVVETSGGAQNGNAICRWALDEFDFDAFDEPGGTRLGPNFAATHIERGISRSTGEYNLKFNCEDIAENVVDREVVVNLERDQLPPRVIKIYRIGDELNIETNEFTSCAFVNNIAGSLADAETLNTNDGLRHKTIITNNFYRVRCTDRFENFRETNIYT